MINNNSAQSMSNMRKDDPTLIRLLCSKEWTEYFYYLSRTVNFDLNVYREDGTLLFSTEENPFCKVFKSTRPSGIQCPGSCNRLMFEALKLNEPLTYKCQAKIINFSFPVERLDQKALIVGRGKFSSYEDFLEFLKVCKDNNLFQIPITTQLNFVGEDYTKAVSQFVHKTLNYLLNGFEEKSKLEEKISRLTTLLDTHTLEILSKNRGLMYRYVLDNIEFLLGDASTAVMVLDDEGHTYKTIYSTGKHRDALMGFRLDPKNPVIYEMLNTSTTVLTVDPEELITTGPLREIKSFYFFPIFVSDNIEGLIGIFDKVLSPTDIKIISSFRDYIQVTLENQSLRMKINRKSDEILASILDLLRSINPTLDRESLFQTILERSIELLKAEQGSLMLVDSDTSELLVEAKKGADDIVEKKMRIPKGEGIAGLVFESEEPLLVEDIENDPRIRQRNKPRYKTKSFVSVPIEIENKVSGVLNISDKINGKAFNEDDLRLIQSFTTSAGIAIERNFLYGQVKDLKRLSVTDPLTGIYNRRYLDSRLTEEINRYKRYRDPFSFLILDIDGFKGYNDTFGHLAGDMLLQDIATSIVNSLRAVDIAARFGGDEFVILFPQTPKVDAIYTANRLKENIQEAEVFKQMELPLKKLTVSIGLTTFPDDAGSFRELIEKTDQALYLAKKGGGNRVVHL